MKINEKGRMVYSDTCNLTLTSTICIVMTFAIHSGHLQIVNLGKCTVRANSYCVSLTKNNGSVLRAYSKPFHLEENCCLELNHGIQAKVDCATFNHDFRRLNKDKLAGCGQIVQSVNHMAHLDQSQHVPIQ